MKIILSKYAGFCDGVKRAYDMAERISKDKDVKKPIFVLGSLVHNKDVVRKIEKMGIKTLHFNGDFEKILGKKRKIGTLVVTAHGIGPKLYKICKERKINVVDTTCPRVLKVQRLAQVFSKRNNLILIIGEKNHKEVKGVDEWSGKKAIILENIQDLKKIKTNPGQKIIVISQTTQNEGFIGNFYKLIKKKYPKSQLINTVCLATHERQEEVRKMARKNDVMIIIGSPKSSNSTNLWKISQEINPKSYFIEGIGDINRGWFEECRKIGVSAGASAPPWVIQEVCSFLENRL